MMLRMQISFPYSVYFIVLSALERRLQGLQCMQQMFLSPELPAAVLLGALVFCF